MCYSCTANPPGEPLDIYQQRTSWRRSRGQARKEEAAIAGLNAGQYGVVPLMKPFGMNLKRVLGIGGQGVACLFARVEIDGSTRKVVVKGSLHGANDKSVAREVKNMRVSLSAVHVLCSTSREQYNGTRTFIYHTDFRFVW